MKDTIFSPKDRQGQRHKDSIKDRITIKIKNRGNNRMLCRQLVHFYHFLRLNWTIEKYKIVKKGIFEQTIKNSD